MSRARSIKRRNIFQWSEFLTKNEEKKDELQILDVCSFLQVVLVDEY